MEIGEDIEAGDDDHRDVRVPFPDTRTAALSHVFTTEMYSPPNFSKMRRAAVQLYGR